MKKSVFATLMGVGLGILMMFAVISVLNMKPDNEEMMAQNDKNTQTESNSATDLDTEWVDTEFVDTEGIDTEEVVTEEGTVEEEDKEGSGLLDAIIDALKPESEKESEDKKPSSSNKEPVDYPYYIKVNRQANCVTVYKKDEKGNYTVPVRAMVCSVGLNNKTRLGIGKISDKYTWRELFGGVYGQYAVRFDGHILFHSVPYTQTKKDMLWEGQYNMLGQPASKGCIRLAVADAKWIYDNCKRGTKVEVYDSPDPGPLGKPVNYQVSPDSPYAGWDPTDPDPANPWNHGVVNIAGVKNITIMQGESVDLLAGVAAKDADGTAIEVKVLEKIDMNVPGTYTITYSATGATRVTVNATAVLTINAEVADTETEVPDTETEVPDTETETPDTETEVPDTETEVPDTETEVPDTETEVPDTETEVPDTETETPDTETETPDTETETPDTETEIPDTETEVQDTEIETPDTEAEVQETETETSDSETEVQDLAEQTECSEEVQSIEESEVPQADEQMQLIELQDAA